MSQWCCCCLGLKHVCWTAQNLRLSDHFFLYSLILIFWAYPWFFIVLIPYYHRPILYLLWSSFGKHKVDEISKDIIISNRMRTWTNSKYINLTWFTIMCLQVLWPIVTACVCLRVELVYSIWQVDKCQHQSPHPHFVVPHFNLNNKTLIQKQTN